VAIGAVVGGGNPCLTPGVEPALKNHRKSLGPYRPLRPTWLPPQAVLWPAPELGRLSGSDEVTRVTTANQAMPRRSLRYGVHTGLFFVMFYLYVWLVIDPRLIHHSWLVNDPRLIYDFIGILRLYFPFTFSTGWLFFWEHLARSGGLVDYGVRFVSQYYCFGWVGALVITAVALYACLCTDVLTRLGGGSRGMVLRYVPALVLLVMYGGYHHSLGMILSLLAALSCFALYLRWPPQVGVTVLLLLPLTCAALYHVAGAGSLLFPVLVAILELSIRRRMLAAVTALACSSVVLWTVREAALEVDFYQLRACLLSRPDLFRGYGCALALGVFFPAVLAAAAVCRRVCDRRTSRGTAERPPAAVLASTGTDAPRTVRRCRLPWRAATHWTVRTALAFVGLGAVAWCVLDRDTRAALEVDYYSQHENWPAVLEAADRASPGTFDRRYDRNVLLALYHTEQLGDEMFRYRQRSLMDLFSPPTSALESGSYFQISRFLLELGQVNLAETYASEALEIMGDLPEVLEHLAIINIVKDRPETAKVFLRALAKNPIHGKKAREMVRRLEEDPSQKSDPRIERIRRAMASRDGFFADMTVENVLQTLLEKDPHNKMAFEFLMAYYLCERRTDRVVAGVNRLEELSYQRIPRHYQEAIIVYCGGVVPAGSPLFAGYRLDPETIRRAEETWKTMGTAPNPKEGVRRAVAAGFGDTYFFYFLCGQSGL
jgi:hypothetical protein